MKYFLILLACCFGFAQTAAQSSSNHLLRSGNDLIHVKVFGKGAPLLVINGGPGMSCEGFVALAEKLSAQNQVFLYDQRGTGQSRLAKVDSSTVTIALMVQDIETIRKYFKIKSWTVFGQSFGGMLASFYAATYPQRTRGLILSASGGVDMDLFSSLNITARLTATERDSLAFWNARIAAGDTSFHARLQRGRFLAPAYLYDKSYVPVIAQRLTQGNAAINALVFQDMRRINFDCKPALRNYQKPVLILQGTDDIIDVKIAEKAHYLLKQSSLVLLPQCGHYGWLDQPELYYKSIGDFLKKV
jgi:proline iminopeptidase